MKKALLSALLTVAMGAAHAASCIQNGATVTLNGVRAYETYKVENYTHAEDILTLSEPICVASLGGEQPEQTISKIDLSGLHPRATGMIQVTGAVSLVPTGRDYAVPMSMQVRESHRINDRGENIDIPAAPKLSGTEYVANLRVTYGKRLHFGSAEAERIVRSFNIDCRSNGRYVPLINLLYARLAPMTTKTLWLESYAQARGGEVRIVDILRGPAAHDTSERVSFEINKWGDLHPVGFTAEAVLNTCFGSYGPIWRQ
jgi:hypothetical protein